MKAMLLILMVLASVAHAVQSQSDFAMKALIVGTWTTDCNDKRSTTEYRADGTLTYNIDGTDFVEKWDVKDGVLLQTDDHQSARMTYFKILFLTKHEWLVLGMTVHSKGYFFCYRTDED